MIGRLFSTKRFLVTILTALIVTSLLPTTSARWLGDWPRDRLQDGLHKTFLVGGLSRLGHVLRPTAVSDPAVVENLAALYEEERIYSAQLRSRLAESEERIRLLSGTNKVLQLSGYARVSARVIDVSGTVSEPVAVIDAGAGAGLESGQSVVAGEILVGTIGNVTPLTATVLLATFDAVQLKVELVPPQPGPPRRRTEALVLYRHEARMYEVELDQQRSVQVGDVARLIDRQVPDEAHGFVVGHVRSVTADPSDPLMFRIVRIEPAPRVTAGKHVIILVPTP